MDTTELYLKTAFCCMACDGSIAPEEVETLRAMSFYDEESMRGLLDKYVQQLGTQGKHFLHQYLAELKAAGLTPEEECQLASIAVQTIEADGIIEYAEVAFFKKIRSRLTVPDEALLAAIPANPAVADQVQPEDYLLPDITEDDDLSLWDNLSQDIALPELP